MEYVIISAQLEEIPRRPKNSIPGRKAAAVAKESKKITMATLNCHKMINADNVIRIMAVYLAILVMAVSSQC